LAVITSVAGADWAVSAVVIQRQQQPTTFYMECFAVQMGTENVWIGKEEVFAVDGCVRGVRHNVKWLLRWQPRIATSHTATGRHAINTPHTTHIRPAVRQSPSPATVVDSFGHPSPIGTHAQWYYPSLPFSQSNALHSAIIGTLRGSGTSPLSFPSPLPSLRCIY
jgi:hypothetical protein